MPLELLRNDITRMQVDAIVNAADPTLLGGGGVDGAIHRAAGPELLRECRGLGGCRPGEAKLTRGYRLPCRYVIHTVGPVWEGGGQGEEETLRACYANSLALALAEGFETVAFPLISAGAYGYPKDQALAVAVGSISRFLTEHDMTVYLLLFGETEFLAGKKLFRDVQEYIDGHYVETHSEARSEVLSRQRRARGAMRETMAAPDMLMQEAVYGALPDLAAPVGAKPDWDELLRRTDEGFSATLLRLIDESGMTDAQCYKRANVDRKLFSKIRSNPAYRPSKPTVCAFAVALRLSKQQAEDLLRRAGFALSRSSKSDIILEYFLEARRYDIYEINEVLFHYDLPLLGN